MAPKGQALDDAICRAIAGELGVTVDYKTLKAASENINKAEERDTIAIKDAAYADAITAGDDEAQASSKAELALKTAIFKYKLKRAWSKAVKKQQPAPAEVVELPNQLDDSLAEPEHGKRIVYSEEIQAAYNRVIGHRVFKDILAASPNPVQGEDAGDCGMQAYISVGLCGSLSISLATNPLIDYLTLSYQFHNILNKASRRLSTTSSATCPSLGRRFTAQAVISFG